MQITRRTLLGSAAATALPLAAARAQKPKIKLGVLTDLSGPYRDATGPTSIVCARQAVEEMASRVPFDIELISADHQNKADIGAAVARRWFDNESVDAVADVPTSSVALA